MLYVHTLQFSVVITDIETPGLLCFYGALLPVKQNYNDTSKGNLTHIPSYNLERKQF